MISNYIIKEDEFVYFFNFYICMMSEIILVKKLFFVFLLLVGVWMDSGVVMGMISFLFGDFNFVGFEMCGLVILFL